MLKDLLANMLSKNTGQKKETITLDFDRDVHMTAKKAKEYGFIDKIITKLPDKK